MNTFTPCFPPVILEKFLDLAKYLADKKTGKASLDINLGTSRLSFSVDHASHLQTGTPSQDLPKKLRKKSPSDQKRDSLRMEKHLEKKRNSTPPADSPSSNNSTPPAEIAQENVIEEPPSFTNITEDMDTVEEIVEEIVPVKSRNKTEANDESKNLSLTSPILHPPPIISPLKSPVTPPKKSFDLDDPNDWPHELSSENSEFLITVVIVNDENDEKSSIASLQRTFKKCNIRSLDPKLRPQVREGYFGYQINFNQLHPNQLQNTLKKIKKNFISVQDSRFCNFIVNGFVLF